MRTVSDEENWRLRVELGSPPGHALLDRLLERVRDREPSDEVAITHDGTLLFAYAATEPVIAGARSAIEEVLGAEGIGARAVLSHWDERLDEWAQVDPPLAGAQKQAAQARERRGQEIQSRTLVMTVGRLIRSELEQTLLDGAAKLGLECEVHEHPHLLSTQVAFTVTGPRHKIDEFAGELHEEQRLTLRADREQMLSPL